VIGCSIWRPPPFPRRRSHGIATVISADRIETSLILSSCYEPFSLEGLLGAQVPSRPNLFANSPTHPGFQRGVSSRQRSPGRLVFVTVFADHKATRTVRWPQASRIDRARCRVSPRSGALGALAAPYHLHYLTRDDDRVRRGLLCVPWERRSAGSREEEGGERIDDYIVAT